MKQTIQNIANHILIVLACVLVVLPAMYAQGSSTKQVLTLQVLELNKIDLLGNSLTLIIDNLESQSLEKAHAINASMTLFWTTNGEGKKITVASNTASPRFALKVVAQNVTPGIGLAAPEVKFSDNGTRDFIVGLGRSAGKCVIRFAASARPEEGVGADTHVVTFTITGS